MRLPDVHRLWPRRLRWRLVLGFVLIVAVLQGTLAGAERVALQQALLDSIRSTLKASIQVALGSQMPIAVAANGQTPIVPSGAFGKAHPVPRFVMEIQAAAQRTATLPRLAASLALPDQPVALIDTRGQVLAYRATLVLDRSRVHPLASAVLQSLLRAAGRAHEGRSTGTIATPDGPYLLYLQPTTWTVLDARQARFVNLALNGPLTPKSNPAAQTFLDALKGDPAARSASLAQLRPALLVVLIARRLGEVQQTVDTVTEIALGGALVVIALATVLSLLVVGRALQPLAAITRGAERLARGDYGHRLALPPGSDEVGRLAAAFDRMAAAIAASFAGQRRFVADASHELRTPLTALRTYADVLLLEGHEADGTVGRVARAMHDLLGRMSRLVDDLLTLSRLDAGVSLHLEPLAVADLLAAAAYEGQTLTHGAQEIVVEAPPQGMMVWGDRDRLRQVLANVVGNACAYSPAGSTITLRAAPDTCWAVIAVQDAGPGIPPDDLARLGERFYRGDAARSRRTGGTGLGLAIARGIVEAHGGHLTIESTLGRGTTVMLCLPRGPVVSPAD
jgi:signal transduction histidine kinase